ncbi:MAG: ABC transporter permease [Pseudomonadota bacterium]|nr:ABC transporter permease [Pseudomonadota bacterium]
MMQVWHSYRQIWRTIRQDKGAILLLFVASLIYSVFYPLPYQREQVQQVPIAVVDLDQSTQSRQLTQLLRAVPELDVVGVTADHAQLQEALWRGEIMGAVIVPQGFGQALLTGRSADLQVASHAGYLLASSKVMAAVSRTSMTLGVGVTSTRLLSRGVSMQQVEASLQPIQLQSRAYYNSHEGYGHYIVPAVMVLIIQQTLLMGVTLILGRLAETQQVPLGRQQYVGMWLAFSTIGFLNCLYFFEVSLRMQGYATAQHTSVLLAFSGLFALCVAAFSLMLARLFVQRERGLQLLLVLAIPLFFISGYPWPVEALPVPLQYLRWMLPSTAGIEGFVAINQMGASWAQIQPQLWALSVITSGSVIIGGYLYRRRPTDSTSHSSVK